MEIALGVLAVYGIALTVLFIRARALNQKINTRIEDIKAWLSVHQELERASGAVIEIKLAKPVDPDSIFFREPSR